MKRRDFLAAITAGGALTSLSTLAAADDPGMRTTQFPLRYSHDEFERDDWIPHHTLDINQDGTAKLSISLEGQNPPTSVKLNSRRTTVLEVVEGESALSGGGNSYSWDVEQASSVGFRLQLGNKSGRGIETARFDNAIGSDVNELVQVNDWPEGTDSLPKTYRFTFNPPDGWSAVSPGEQLSPNTFDITPAMIQYGSSMKNFFAVGDFDVHERAAGETTIRYAEFPEADHLYAIDEAIDLLVDATSVIEDKYGATVHYPWAAIFVPSDYIRGGLVNEHSVLYGDDDPLIGDGGSTLTVELAGLYTRAVTCAGDRCRGEWYVTGAKSWIGKVYTPYAIGRVDHKGLRRMVEAWITGSNDARDHEDPLRVPVTDSPITKGSAIFMILDMEIRARTDGEQDIGAWVRQISDQRILQYLGDARLLITDEEARPLLYEITGVDYTKFYERIVHGSEFPDNFVEEVFSIENPWPVYAAFEYPSIEVPNEISVDEPVEVTVEMRNEADRPQRRTLDLVVDDEGVAATDVQLDPGEGTTVTLEHTFTSAVEYVVQVPPAFKETIVVSHPNGDESTAQGTHDQTGADSGPADSGEASPSPDATVSPGQPGLGVLSTLAGVGGAIGYSKFRSSPDDE